MLVLKITPTQGDFAEACPRYCNDSRLEIYSRLVADKWVLPDTDIVFKDTRLKMLLKP